MNRKLLYLMLCCLALAACHQGNETPKPQAYLRIDLPPHAYTLCDTAALPFTFERSNLSQIEWKKNQPTDKWSPSPTPSTRAMCL